MSETIVVLERPQEFANSRLFSAAAAHSKAATHPRPNESCVTANHHLYVGLSHSCADARPLSAALVCTIIILPSRVSPIRLCPTIQRSAMDLGRVKTRAARRTDRMDIPSGGVFTKREPSEKYTRGLYFFEVERKFTRL